ncbi:MAG: 3-methyl-2-oxobutanoate hydroxymethyltransferase [Methylococcaceae bacterium]|nr:3-methyl-2-oxobutanoate hydroxymethyltransferase [Methylococcaceae bacterium]
MNDPLTLLSVLDLQAMKQAGEKITCLTAYDASFSALIDAVGIDIILVGDSAGMVIQGQPSTLSATLDDMVYHTRCVTRARKHAFVIADLPFMTYSTPQFAAENAARLMREAGAQMVKFEGAHIETVHFLVAQGIPVCGHLGVLPQSVNVVGSYKVRGRTTTDAELIIEQALALQHAGIGLLVVECIPAVLAKQLSQLLDIPVIGIGAGVDCDGQILVSYDMLNITRNKHPRFVKDFMHGAGSIEAAIRAYKIAVKQAEFPAPEHSYL